MLEPLRLHNIQILTFLGVPLNIFVLRKKSNFYYNSYFEIYDEPDIHDNLSAVQNQSRTFKTKRTSNSEAAAPTNVFASFKSVSIGI